jgi:hypothetical protein
MGMFDDIMVPKSYLKDLLTKEQEKLIHGNHYYQTKSLDNALRRYKVYKQKLFLNDTDVVLQESKDSKWVSLDYSGEVFFYDNIKDKEGNCHWVEFRFVFLEGKLDAKYLEEFYIQRTIGQIKEEDRKWKDARKRQLKYEKTLKYKIYFFIFKILHKLLNKARGKVTRYDYPYGTTKV